MVHATFSMRTIGLAAIAAAVLTLAGCAHDGPPTADPPRASPGTAVPAGVTNAQNNADLQVVDRLATARCRRAEVCNDIGPGKTFDSLELCMGQVRGNIANELTAYNCPHGVDDAAAGRCTATIEARECGKSDAPICTEALCLK